jgi:hypothetical protein
MDATSRAHISPCQTLANLGVVAFKWLFDYVLVPTQVACCERRKFCERHPPTDESELMAPLIKRIGYSVMTPHGRIKVTAPRFMPWLRSADVGVVPVRYWVGRFSGKAFGELITR